VPVYTYLDRRTRTTVLTTDRGEAELSGEARVAFYAEPPGAQAPSPATLLLCERVDKASGERSYVVRKPDVEGDGRGDSDPNARPVCRVWENPTLFNPFDCAART
jgi:hypothetical protein